MGVTSGLDAASGGMTGSAMKNAACKTASKSGAKAIGKSTAK